MENTKLKQQVEELIQVGDKVNIDLKYGNDEPENIDLILTENTFNIETGEVSKLSPIGSMIHLQKPGFSGHTIINNVKIEIIINKKVVKEKKKEF